MKRVNQQIQELRWIVKSNVHQADSNWLFVALRRSTPEMSLGGEGANEGISDYGNR